MSSSNCEAFYVLLETCSGGWWACTDTSTNHWQLFFKDLKAQRAEVVFLEPKWILRIGACLLNVPWHQAELRISWKILSHKSTDLPFSRWEAQFNYFAEKEKKWTLSF